MAQGPAKPARKRQPKPRPARKRGCLGRIFGGLLVTLLVVGVLLPLALVLAYRFVPPPLTILMVEPPRIRSGRASLWRMAFSIALKSNP